MVQRARDLFDNGIGSENFIQLNDIVLGYTVQNAMVPGKIEQFHYIIDAGDLRTWEIPVKQLVNFVTHTSKFYRHRAYKVHVINLPWMIRKMINFMYNFLDDFQKQQLKYFGTDFREALLEDISADNLEQKYGGTAPDIKKGEYWPPRINI